MKKISTLFLLTISAISFGQVKDSVASKKVCTNLYVGIGAQVHDDLNINKNLRLKNLPEVQNVISEFVVGMNIFGEKFSGAGEFGLMYSNPEKDGKENKYYGFNSRLKFHYNLINKEKIAFTSGINVASTSSSLDVYSSSNTIDLNDLEPNNNSGHLNLKNQMYYAGPSLSVYLFRKSFPIQINAAYEIGFTRGRWKSDFGSVLNTVNESGKNRFVFGITLL